MRSMKDGNDQRARDRELAEALRRWDEFAPKYDWTIGFFERILFSGGREWVCSQGRGEVLELGIGTGRNLSLYGDDVRVTGIDLSPAMLAIARRRADRLRRPVELVTGDAAALDFPDQSFDTVVSTLALCSIPDDRGAVAEAKRVLRPGGRFLLLEHVGSPAPVVRGVQRILDPLTVRFQGDHLLREPARHVRAEGLEIEEMHRLKWGIVERLAARKPEQDGSAT